MEECQAVAQCLPTVAMVSLPSASPPLTHLHRSGEKQFQHEVLQRIGTQVDDVVGRGAARTIVASGNGGRHTACTNVGHPCVPPRFCNAYECRSAVLTADLKHVQM